MSLLHFTLLQPTTTIALRDHAVDWPLVKDTLQSWIVEQTKIDTSRVLFGGQNAQRPKGIDAPWVSIWIMGDVPEGLTDEQNIDNPNPSPGKEIIKLVTGTTVVTCMITCYGMRNATDTSETHVYISDLIHSANDDDVSSDLADHGVCVWDYSDPVTIGGVVGTTRIEPRTTFTLTFTTGTLRWREMTFIETVNATLNEASTNPVKTFDFGFTLV